MKLYEKLCFKLGTNVGTALYGGNLTPEQKRQVERNAYQEMLEEDRMKASLSRRSGVSNCSSNAQVCANCHYFMNGVGIGNANFCAKHGIDFTYDDISNGVHRSSTCGSFSKKGYW